MQAKRIYIADWWHNADNERRGYAYLCKYALAELLYPKAGHGIMPFVYESDGVRYELYDNYSESSTDIGAWRHSAIDGWYFCLCPFDIVLDVHKDRVLNGEVEWHQLGSLTHPTPELFAELAVVAMKDHPRDLSVAER